MKQVRCERERSVVAGPSARSSNNAQHAHFLSNPGLRRRATRLRNVDSVKLIIVLDLVKTQNFKILVSEFLSLTPHATREVRTTKRPNEIDGDHLRIRRRRALEVQHPVAIGHAPRLRVLQGDAHRDERDCDGHTSDSHSKM